MRRVLLSLVLLVLATPALASDGVLEINQTCAVETGCFSGDTAGFPVEITGAEGRSYRLTSDLLIADRSTTAITITRRDTSIDLNGFEIVLSLCQVLTCAPVVGSGIGISAFAVLGVSVKNGSITGTGSDGIRLGDQAEVSGLRVRWNGGDGIEVGSGSIVSGNTAYQNGSDEIFVLGSGSTVSGNTAYQNGDDGINVTGGGSTVSGNTVYLNEGGGIVTGVGSTVSGNTSHQNDSNGISAGFDSAVQGNTVSNNGAYGLILFGGTGYRENVITNNTTAPVLGGLDAGANVINGVVTPTP